MDIWNGKIDQASMQATVKSVADSVHANSTAYVTVGSAMIDGVSMWTGLGLDFYQAHWYDYMSSGGWCARCTDYASVAAAQALDRPLVIGEFFGASSVDSLQRDEDFYAKGYAGAWAWSLFPGSTSDGITVDLNASKTFTSRHADVGPKGSGSSPTPTATPTKRASATPTKTATTAPTKTGTAQPTATATATTPANAKWSASASASKSTVSRGSKTNITASVQANVAATALVDVEVYDANGNRIGQQFFDGQAFKAGVTRSFTFGMTIPSNAATGTWTVKVGIFNSGWAGMLAWDDSAGTFRVQ